MTGAGMLTVDVITGGCLVLSGGAGQRGGGGVPGGVPHGPVVTRRW